MKNGHVPKMTMPTNVAELGGSADSGKIKGNSACGGASYSVNSASGGNMGTNVRQARPISPCCSIRNVPPA